MRSRLHLAPVFTRKLAPMPLQFANPVWVKDDRLDLDYHVRRVRLPRPGTRAQFEDCAARLHAEPLDRSRPLWQLVVIDGLPGGQAAYYFKVHHAVVDGQSGVMLAQTLFDLTPKPRRIAAGKAVQAEHPGMAELAAAGLKHDAGQYIKLVRQLPDIVKTLAGLFGKMPEELTGRLTQNAAFGPKTALNLPITGDRGFAGASVPLYTLKALAHAHEAKLNDVVMALCSGMLRRWLAAHGGIPKKPLIAAMPISVRESGNTDYTTQATMAVVNLNTHLADPVKRLIAIRDAAGGGQGRRQARQGPDAHRLPDHRRALGDARPGHAVRPLGPGQGHAAAGQRGHLQRAGPAGAAVCRRCAHAELLADVDRRARPGAEHHRAELCRDDGLRLHHRAQPGRRCARAVGGADGGAGRTAGRERRAAGLAREGGGVIARWKAGGEEASGREALCCLIGGQRGVAAQIDLRSNEWIAPSCGARLIFKFGAELRIASCCYTTVHRHAGGKADIAGRFLGPLGSRARGLLCSVRSRWRVPAFWQPSFMNRGAGQPLFA